MRFEEVAGWSIADHLAARRRGVSAEAVIRAVLDGLANIDDPAVIIGAPIMESAMADARRADGQTVRDLPLHGVPFVVKDNIDVAGVPTTCGCPSYTYTPEADALVVARLRAAGAIPVAKANLDQFATGLVGTRSPYGTPRNPIDPALVPGGSSSGSAVAVARGLVPFSLGTDTAGSGRVPAAMCRIVGLKPTVGRLPSQGIVPAVRRIDCPSVFARTVGEARLVAGIAAGFEPSDPYSRAAGEAPGAIRRVGVPTALPAELLDADAAPAFFDGAVKGLDDAGVEAVPMDMAPFLEVGRLLYGGTYVAERTAAVGSFLDEHPEDADPTVRSIILAGNQYTAVEAYRCEYRLAELVTRTANAWRHVDALLLPTTPGVATLEEVKADPIGVNTRLGTFTTFANLLDLAVISVPLGERVDGRPSGVQLIGPAWSDDALADLATALLGEPVDASQRGGEHTIVVVGAHLTGMPLNGQLTSRGARLVRATATAPCYRLYALAGTVPPKPGLERVADGGAPIAVELWALPPRAFASFVAEVPAPLAIGSLELADGTWHKGFVCEPLALRGATDITRFGGWRAYVDRIEP